jgi:mannose-6-phosphate isomerase
VLDADKTLSVQVHPNDETAARFGGEAKTEMWYMLDAEPGAVVYCGLNEGVTPEAFRQAIAENRLETWLHVLPVKKGDAVFVPGGRVHAIGAGCLLLEVQQNSNTTYRIYDWGRVGDDGKPRQLHIEEAMRVSTWDDIGAALAASTLLPTSAGVRGRELVLESAYFRMEKWLLDEKSVLHNDGKSFQVLFAANADLRVNGGGEEVLVKRGSSVLLPAALAEAVVAPSVPGAELIRVTLP